MTNLQCLELLINLARLAPAPAETHDRALEAAQRLARLCQASDAPAPGKQLGESPRAE